MTSLLLGATKATGFDPTSVINVNFENLAVGSKNLVDYGTGKRTFTRTVLNGAGDTSDGVINDPTFGKCYKFTGNVYFSANTAVQYSTRNYILTCQFVPQSTNMGYIFMTGDYPGGVEWAGSSVSLNQFASQYIQYFQCQGTGSPGAPYQRLFPGNISNPGAVLETVVITNNGGTISMVDTRTGTTSSAAYFNTGGDTYTVFGTTILQTNLSFVGLLKSFKIQYL